MDKQVVTLSLLVFKGLVLYEVLSREHVLAHVLIHTHAHTQAHTPTQTARPVVRLMKEKALNGSYAVMH